MQKFNTKELTAITLLASIWAVINAIVGPAFWNLTHLPILCDMLGVATLSLTIWWVRKPGASIIVGLIATLISFIMNPGGVQFLGFTGATFVFEAITLVMGHKRVLENGYMGWGLLLLASVAATTTAGVIIATFFLNPNFLASAFGGVMVFSGIHGAGGAIGSALGVLLIKALEARNINPV